MNSPHPVILITFAGRRDRMELLTFYVAEAIRRGLIDEWHVWDFSRNEGDSRWLSSRFPVVGRTADDPSYCAAGSVTPGTPWRSRVRAAHDVHIGLEPCDAGPNAAAYELVIGGWSNRRTVLRHVDNFELLAGEDMFRSTHRDLLADRQTPGILSPCAFREVEVSVGESGLVLSVDGAEILTGIDAVAPGRYRVHVKTGFGADGEWRPHDTGTAEWLYRSRDKGPDGWMECYRYYSARSEYYADAVFLKCDDDIVYLQLDRLAEFIGFRLGQPEYFLVSANVVNNNICAYFQQLHGAIPRDRMELELPAGGWGGKLWRSAELAAALHDQFLSDRQPFEAMPRVALPWKQRLSINFISWLGRDLSYFTAIDDDEKLLSMTIPGYLGRPNCIYFGFLASHLSYFPQDDQLDRRAILARYRQLAAEHGLCPAPSPEQEREADGTTDGSARSSVPMIVGR